MRDFSKRFFLLALSALLVASCAEKEKKLFQEGKFWEEKGEKTKALYYYELSLRENSDYPPVLKRMGLLLAESGGSTATSLYYLEKYYKTHKEDQDIQRELFRLYLTTGYEKEALQILEEVRFLGKKEVADFFESTYLCLTRNYKQKDYLQALETNILSNDPYYAPWVRACESKI
ncbi:tetratricopeptide repeat protein [Leptospira idonii]|uniref:Tetratricopeptide repeat protein n=1 Tax=Leptospira idonii TaxID=1193500 RepID=A0A4R9LXC5_9LEPT|nr:tetratricopeptide repeat protein [Leptospira idonii]TGN17669.1 tetratricopeptide repeat protein [Leptospira idonii]